MKTIEINMKENDIQTKSKNKFKKMVEQNIAKAAFIEYSDEQYPKTKTMYIKYNKLQIQLHM